MTTTLTLPTAHSATSDNSLFRRLTAGLANQVTKIYGPIILGVLIGISSPATEYFGLTQKAGEMRADFAQLPLAQGEQAGTRAIMTGTIAKETKPLEREFVAYVNETYHSGGRRQTSYWGFDDGLIQTFRIQNPAGGMFLAQPKYRFSPQGEWLGMATRPVLEDWDHVEARHVDGDKRTRGFVAGGAVTAIGTITEDGTFDAEYVLGGTLEEVDARLAKIESGEDLPVEYWITMAGFAAIAITLLFFVRARIRAFNEAA